VSGQGHRIAVRSATNRWSAIRRGGVPVFSRIQVDEGSKLSPSRFDGASPLRPQLYFISPTWASPFRNVPGRHNHRFA